MDNVIAGETEGGERCGRKEKGQQVAAHMGKGGLGLDRDVTLLLHYCWFPCDNLGRIGTRDLFAGSTLLEPSWLTDLAGCFHGSKCMLAILPVHP